jgi:membrane-associated protease RseP (regulator of RpoE activity)
MLRTRWLSGLAMTLLCVASAEAQDAAAQKAAVEKAPGQATATFGVANVKVSAYWLGVHCRPAGELLRSQLGLAENQGLVVHLVVPDSPAEAAGIKRHDVLVTAGGKPLGEVAHVTEAVDAADGKQLKIELIRVGKREELIITPDKRPERVISAVPRQPGDVVADWVTIHKWLERVEPGEFGEGPRRFRFLRSGTILPPGPPPLPTLPGNLRVTITRQADKPAAIVVQRGEEKWELTAEELDKLPDNIRPHIEQFINQPMLRGPIGHIHAAGHIPPPTEIA